MAGTDKRIRKQTDRFTVWKDGDKHAPMSIRSQATDKKKKQKDKNERFQQKKKKGDKDNSANSDKNQQKKKKGKINHSVESNVLFETFLFFIV